jgi:4-diphosphocytidyl-2-C-methyl-D-erythritol kinase
VRRDTTPNSPCVSVRVAAKINLFLAVRGRLPDGYHELVTVLQAVSLYDELRVGLVGPPGRGQHPAARRRMRVLLRHDGGPEVPAGGDNLAVKAARILGSSANVIDFAVVDGRAASLASPDDDRPPTPCTILDLRKGIPVAGGMAGGSADAAAALVALNELWGCRLDRDHLRGVAAGVGSDVPFCVVGGTALATGRGTQLAQVLCRGTFHWVVCQASEPLATAAVYRAWDRICRPGEVQPDAVLQALRSSDVEALGAALHNDLQPAAFALRPELEEHARALREAGALGVVLSGSGPTLLGLASDEPAASALAERVAALFDRVEVARSPVGGPELRRR